MKRKRVSYLMRGDDLLSLRKKHFVLTTNSDHRATLHPNLVPELAVAGGDHLWVADITDIQLFREFIV